MEYIIDDAVDIDVSAADSPLIPSTCIGFYVGVSAPGDIVVRLRGASADTTFSNVVQGQCYPFAISYVRQTGTTVTGIRALLQRRVL